MLKDTGMITLEELLAKAADAVKLDLNDFTRVQVKIGHKPLINFVPKTGIIIFVCPPELEYLCIK